MIELPGKKVMVIDAPGARNSISRGAGKRIVTPFLLELGYDKIDYMVVSHPHLDHYGGMNFLATVFGVDEFWYNGDVPPCSRFSSLLDTLREKETLFFKLNDKMPARALGQGVSVAFFNKHTSLDVNKFSNGRVNNNSIVMKLCYEKSCLLFTGDIQKKAERHVAKYKQRLNSLVLKIPHHGSKTSSTEKFLLNVNPLHAILDSKSFHHKNFPHKSVLKRYADLGIKVLNPNVSGAISYKFKKNGAFDYETFFK